MNGGLSNLQNNSIGYNQEKIAKRNKTIKIGLIALGVIVGIVLIYFLISNVFVMDVSNKYYGKWECTKDVSLELKKDDSFEMIYPQAEIYGNYTIDSYEVKDGVIHYMATLKATERIINGVSNKSPYTVKFEFDVPKENVKSMSIINIENYNMYACTKKS